MRLMQTIHGTFSSVNLFILTFPHFFSAEMARQKCGKFKVVYQKMYYIYQNFNLILALGDKNFVSPRPICLYSAGVELFNATP